MYYSDVSCTPQKTLPEIDRMGVRDLIPLDWMGFIIVTSKRVTIDGDITYCSVDTVWIIEYLTARMSEIIMLENNWTDSCICNGVQHNLMLVPIRSQDYYKVFFVGFNTSQAYKEHHLLTMSIFLNILYRNVLLHNESIQEKEYLQNVLNSSESLIITTNIAGEITNANKTASKFLGANGVIGSKLTEWAKGMDLSLVPRVAEENRSIFFKEVMYTRSRSRKTIFNLSASPLHDSKKRVVGVVIIATDITSRKIFQRQLDQLKQFSYLGEVAAGVAHDIKNPLMSIRSCARLLQKELTDAPQYSKLVEPIIREVDRINEVVEQMISYGNHEQETNYAMININEVLENAINVVHFHQGSKYITIQKELAAGLPFVRGYNVQLKQSFINILFNAMQAIEQEGIIQITSRYDENKKFIRISIADNGIGISAKELKKVFRPFYTTKQSGGGGLGLSIVHRVIKEHRGKIEIASKIHQGTSIEIYLPC